MAGMLIQSLIFSEGCLSITPNDGNKKRSGLKAESLSTAKNLQKVIQFQIAPNPLCFLLRVISRICLIISLNKNNLKINHFLFGFIR